MLLTDSVVGIIRKEIQKQSQCFSAHKFSTPSQCLSQLLRVLEALELNFKSYSGIFWPVTWFTKAHATFT